MLRTAFLILLFHFGLNCFELKGVVKNYEHVHNIPFPTIRKTCMYINSLVYLRRKRTKKNENKIYLKRKSFLVTLKEDLHSTLNNKIKKFSRQILQNENFNLPNHCLIEENKVYDNYEYQTSVLIFLENILKNEKNVRNEALRILKQICSDIIESLHVSPNGILNIRICNSFIQREFLRFYKLDTFGCSEFETGEYQERIPQMERYQNDSSAEEETRKLNQKNVVVLDYCGVNMAKQMHMGHLKSLFLGNSLSNIFRFLNYTVKCRNHIGDWNMNIGMVICFLILFPYDVINQEKLNEHKEHSMVNNVKCDKLEERNESISPPNDTNDHRNRQINLTHHKGGGNNTDTFANEDEDMQMSLLVENYLNMLNKINHEIFHIKYQQLDTTKWKDISLHNIEHVYKIAKKLYANSEIFKKMSKYTLNLMYKKDQKIISMWDIICTNTKRDNKEIFEKFRIRKLIDKGESFYIKYVPTILEKMNNANIIFHLEGKTCLLLRRKKGNDRNIPLMNEGTQSQRKETYILSSNEEYYDVIQVTDENYEYIKKKDINFLKKNFTIVTLKNDISFTYAAIDIAAIQYRVECEKANKILYITDENQRKHFMQIFSIAKFLNILPKHVECVCLNYGFVLNSENKKMKTKDFSKENISIKSILQNLNMVSQNGHKKSEYGNMKIMYLTKYREKLFLSSIIYSYMAVKSYKRQLISNIMKGLHSEYVYIILCYNKISSILGHGKNCDYSAFLGHKESIHIDNNIKKMMLYIIRFKNVTEEVIHSYSIEKLCSFLFSLSQKVHCIFKNSFIKKFIIHLKNMNVQKFLKILNRSKKEGKFEGIERVKSYGEKHNIVDDKELENIEDKIIKSDLFLFIKNSGLLDICMNKSVHEQSAKIKTFIFNRIFEVLIMQSYLYIVSKTFHMLNLHLVNLHEPLLRKREKGISGIALFPSTNI
ncbi:arginine--tRNA ligase [Plasmodium gonderi]|uniref:Arginine--tRNA ligase n=1 Tax=Plasmodium gonderi TaxID=77519 RepID=A0A1Y1JID4_PLAGO|nr:arginine--tRNA ligase [Plasmodium gonderi]GAW80203.1 arginine--tRNA ligase [Plasmodium gonderi]